jgi:uncharacterized protein (TIGR03086 family)
MDLTTMQRACASTDRIVDGVTPAHYNLLTPCEGWDVRALLNHLLGTLSLGTRLLADIPPEGDMAPGALPEVDLVDDDLAKAYRGGVEALLAAASGDALTRIHTTPLGEMPGAVLGGFTTLDIAVHGWDLAKATGQDPAIDTSLANEVLAFARQTITDTTRAPRIGPEVTVGPGAPVIDQLVGYLGRHP